MSTAKKTTKPQAAASAPTEAATPAPKVYSIHRVTNLFPQVDQPTLAELTESIKSRGLLEPIKLAMGEVIDGRARLQACNDAGVEPRYEEVKLNEAEVFNFVVDVNLRRRHLDESQRAVVAAKMASYKIGANQHTAPAVSQGQAAKVMGISVDSLQRAKKVQDKGIPALNEAVISGKVDVTNAAIISELSPLAQAVVAAMSEKDIKAAAKAINIKNKADKQAEQIKKIVKARSNTVPLAGEGNRFEVIVADPAWDYLGKGQTPYDTMSLDAIKNMPVKTRAADNAVLLLWVPASLVGEGMAVMDAWGFKFKTSAVWRKGESGLGSYFRVNHELVFVGTRGELPSVKETFASCFDAPRQEHSRKPTILFDMLNKMYPELTKVELFCRGKPQPGWEGWGNECEGGIDMPTAGTPAEPTNESQIADIGDQLMAAIGMNSKNPDPGELDPMKGLIYGPTLASKLKEGRPILMQAFQQQFAQLQRAAIESVSATPPAGTQPGDRANRL